MTRRDRGTVLALVLILGLVAVLVALPDAGGGPAASVAPSAASGTGGGSPPATVYREGVLGSWTSITPISAETAADRQLVALVFSGLVRLGPDGDPVPDLAQSWTVDPKGRSYTFSLRPGATWQDGSPVTAEDVAFTFRTLQDPGYTGPMGISWRAVTVTALDSSTVRFDLATPLGGFLQAMTLPLLPAHLLAGMSPSQIAMSPFAATPVGSGRYRVASIDRSRAVLERVAPAGEQTAGTSTAGSAGNLDRIELEFFPDQDALVTAFTGGALDAVAGLPPAAVASLAASDGTQVLRYPSATLTAVVPNERGQSAFKSLAVRRALSIAIDRDAIVRDVMLGQATRADGLVPPSSWAFSASETPTIAFDRTAATKALRSAGWTRGGGSWVAQGHSKPLVLQLIAPDAATNALAFATAQAVAAAWRSIGFNVVLTGVSRDGLAKQLQTGTYMIAVVSVNLGLDPDLYPFLGSTQARTSGSNVAGVQSLVLDGLLRDARKPGSITDRRKAYAKLQGFLSTSGIIMPLYYADLSVVASAALTGPTVREVADPGDRYWDVLTWRLADGR